MPPTEALAGGGAGNISGGKGDGWSGGGGGGGGGGDGAGDGEAPKKRGFSWKGWEDRVAYDPEFPFKVLLEQVWRTAGASGVKAHVL